MKVTFFESKMSVAQRQLLSITPLFSPSSLAIKRLTFSGSRPASCPICRRMALSRIPTWAAWSLSMTDSMTRSTGALSSKDKMPLCGTELCEALPFLNAHAGADCVPLAIALGLEDPVPRSAAWLSRACSSSRLTVPSPSASKALKRSRPTSNAASMCTGNPNSLPMPAFRSTTLRTPLHCSSKASKAPNKEPNLTLSRSTKSFASTIGFISATTARFARCGARACTLLRISWTFSFSGRGMQSRSLACSCRNSGHVMV
mmetsp:Transcript_74175/g.158945  ORF Transcript_74175/g.158945 Transcript_74175/m.158945 type:complete len:259 (-) Transcript_74175:708-1484(-)